FTLAARDGLASGIARAADEIADAALGLLGLGDRMSETERRLTALGIREQLEELREQFGLGSISAEEYALRSAVLRDRLQEIADLGSPLRSFFNGVVSGLRSIIAEVARAIVRLAVLSAILAGLKLVFPGS